MMEGYVHYASSTIQKIPFPLRDEEAVSGSSGYHLMEIYNSEHWLPKFHRILLFFNLLPFLSLISPNVESWNIHIKLFCFVLLQIDCVYKDVLTLLNWFLPNSCSVA